VEGKMENRLNNRHSTRLRGYDYTLNGIYYITICSFNKRKLFGDIQDGKIRISDLGLIVQEEWLKTEKLRKYVILGEFIIMPNHFHGIIIIQNSVQSALHFEDERKNFAASLGSIMINFKAAVTKQCRSLTQNNTLEIWQRNYFDHIIRNEDDLNRCREYIIQNPANWNKDELFMGSSWEL
jgi:putative transposase